MKRRNTNDTKKNEERIEISNKGFKRSRDGLKPLNYVLDPVNNTTLPIYDEETNKRIEEIQAILDEYKDEGEFEVSFGCMSEVITAPKFSAEQKVQMNREIAQKMREKKITELADFYDKAANVRSEYREKIKSYREGSSSNKVKYFSVEARKRLLLKGDSINFHEFWFMYNCSIFFVTLTFPKVLWDSSVYQTGKDVQKNIDMWFQRLEYEVLSRYTSISAGLWKREFTKLLVPHVHVLLFVFNPSGTKIKKLNKDMKQIAHDEWVDTLSDFAKSRKNDKMVKYINDMAEKIVVDVKRLDDPKANKYSKKDRDKCELTRVKTLLYLAKDTGLKKEDLKIEGDVIMGYSEEYLSSLADPDKEYELQKELAESAIDRVLNGSLDDIDETGIAKNVAKGIAARRELQKQVEEAGLDEMRSTKDLVEPGRFWGMKGFQRMEKAFPKPVFINFKIKSSDKKLFFALRRLTQEMLDRKAKDEEYRENLKNLIKTTPYTNFQILFIKCIAKLVDYIIENYGDRLEYDEEAYRYWREWRTYPDDLD